MKNKPFLKHIIILLRDLLILIVIGNVLTLFTIEKELWSVETVLRNCMFSILIGYPAWKGMIYIVIILEKRLPWLKYPLRRLIVQALSMIFFSALIIFIGFFTWFSLAEGLDFKAAMGYILPSLKVVYIFMFLSLILGNAILFFKNWREATIQQEELKRAHLSLQYQTLRDQVKPHFLFNSLSSLVTLINTDAERATQFVHKLSDVYRYVLDQGENELVAVNEEVKFVKDYLFLQKIRFGDNLQVKFNLKKHESRSVVPLSLQLILENAIKHNEISAENPLIIDIFNSEKGHIVIRNNLQKIEVSEGSLGLGIENLRKRIKFFTDEPMHISEENAYFMVSIPTVVSPSSTT